MALQNQLFLIANFRKHLKKLKIQGSIRSTNRQWVTFLVRYSKALHSDTKGCGETTSLHDQSINILVVRQLKSKSNQMENWFLLCGCYTSFFYSHTSAGCSQQMFVQIFMHEKY